jgi:Fic family protein
METLGALEKFLHNDPIKTRPLVKAALAHVQFETIHPFLDGNGRLGRLLITLLLCAEGVLSQPLLYLSLHFKEHRTEYFRLLQEVRQTGDWEAWLEFFLTGVLLTAESAIQTARRLLSMFQRHAEQLAGESANVLRLHTQLQRTPVVSVPAVAKVLGVTHPTATKALRTLEQKQIVSELTGGEYRRLYAYTGYLDLLNESDSPHP